MVSPSLSVASGSATSPASGSKNAMSSPSAPSQAPFQLAEKAEPEASQKTEMPQKKDLATATEELRDQLSDDAAAQKRLDEVFDALQEIVQSQEAGNEQSPARLQDALGQLWQRQSLDPAAMQAMQQFLTALQSHLAGLPGGKSLVAELRGMQNQRPLSQGAVLGTDQLRQQAPHQLAQLANGAPLGQLENIGKLTQQPSEAHLLSLLTAKIANGEQLTELTALASLRQAQPQIPVASGTVSAAQTGKGHEFSPLTLDKQTSMWSEQMLAPLTDRLRVQTQMNIRQATLRLDPPDLGKLELQVRSEGDRVFVQISATNPMVRDQLLQLADKMRQDLMLGTQYAQVDVNIGQHAEQDNRQTQFAESEQDIAGAMESAEATDSKAEQITSDHVVDTYI